MLSEGRGGGWRGRRREAGERAVGERQERGAKGVGGGGEQLEEEDLPVEDGARRLAVPAHHLEYADRQRAAADERAESFAWLAACGSGSSASCLNESIRALRYRTSREAQARRRVGIERIERALARNSRAARAPLRQLSLLQPQSTDASAPPRSRRRPVATKSATHLRVHPPRPASRSALARAVGRRRRRRRHVGGARLAAHPRGAGEPPSSLGRVSQLVPPP